MRWLVAACGSALVVCVVLTGTYEPIVHGEDVSYRFIAPSVSVLVRAWLPVSMALVAAFMTMRRRSPSGRWMAPLVATAAIAIGVVPGLASAGERFSVLVYLFFDLRWWWIAGLTCLAAIRAGAPSVGRAFGPGDVAPPVGGPEGPPYILLALDAGLFALVIGWALLTSPTMRFDNGLHGDEPKYIRICEAWYQGAGLNIEAATTVATQSVAASPAMLANVSLVMSLVPETFHDLSGDLGDFIHDPARFRWNRVRSANGFIRAKHGGVYQVHAPGVSAVLMPGYIIDRYLLASDTSPDGKFPSSLVMTNMMMLLVYGIAAVALFRLLRHALRSDTLAWCWAALGMLTMPMTAFAFQFYPELPALVIVIGVTNYLLFSDRSRLLTAAMAGAAIGALDWCHPRFIIVAACLLITGAIRLSGARRRMFVASAAVVLLSAMAFDYHVTGSWSPTARWDATGDGVRAEFGDIAMNLIAYGFDRVWGVLPHNLLLVGALPGLAVLFRTSRAHALFIGAVVAALLVPAAAHSLSAGGTTPGRFVVAVPPLLTWPIAMMVRRFWSSNAMRATTVVVVTLSLATALTYNAHHFKSFATMADANVSGWALNLAFPVIRGDAWPASAPNVALFVAYAGAALALTALAYWKTRATAQPDTALRLWHLAYTVAVLAVICVIGTAANQDWTSRTFLTPAAIAVNDPR